MTKEITQKIIINFEDDGSFLSAMVELATLHDDGRVAPKGRREATKAELDSLLPDKGETVSQAQTVASERDSALEAKATAEAERDEALAQAASEVSKKEANTTELEAKITEKQAEIDQLKAELNPVDKEGFAVLSPIQIRLALLGAGIPSTKMQEVISAITDDVQRETATAFWEYSTSYHRDHAMITMFAGALGLTDEQVDGLWVEAAKI